MSCSPSQYFPFLTYHRRLCRDFAKNGTCDFKNCRFRHGPSRGPKARSHDLNSQENDNLTKKPISGDQQFREWRRDIPLNTGSVRSLGVRLGSFFTEARRLVDLNDTLLQDVIRCLSKEGGLMRIQELIEREYDGLSPGIRQTIFTGQFVPFLELITHPSVLGSLLLEQSVGTIYNVMFGPLGRRGAPLINFLAGVLEDECKIPTASTIQYLELCLLVFLKLLELNSTAFICEPLKPSAQKFEDTFLKLCNPDWASNLPQAKDYLERIKSRLDIGSSLPTIHTTNNASAKGKPAIVVQKLRNPPGGRHDNDFEDICKINIMPTFQEVSAEQEEYLPVQDPRQWHIAGVPGLLDRNFRLLREDTVGQLRDAIHAETRQTTRHNANRRQLRTHVYKQVKLSGISIDRMAGLQFVVQFQQPQNVRKMKLKERQDWWQCSKRLQPSALICLVDSRGSPIFCTVSSPSRFNPGKDSSHPYQDYTKPLWEKENVACATLNLVDASETNVQFILDQYRAVTHSSMVLVEFPGVLLPAFQPTLQALQRLKGLSEFPFSDFLVPPVSGIIQDTIDVPPPVHATKLGFAFDLSCLMTKGSTMTIRPGHPVDISMLERKSDLDKAQAAALVNALQRRIGVIQGPPGTGKSFTGIALIKVLLANRMKAKANMGPIVCVCYTNHALDQLLEELVEKDVTKQIIRIGSQSKSELLEPLNLRKAVQAVERTRAEKSDLYHVHKQLDEVEEEFGKLGLQAGGLDNKLKTHLFELYQNHYSQLFDVDEDGFQRVTHGKSQGVINRWLASGFRGHGEPRTIGKLKATHVDQMTTKERHKIRGHWLQEIKAIQDSQAQRILEAHTCSKREFDKMRDEKDLRCLRDAHVIGLTTTGLARNINMLRHLPSKVVLCEEAGEVLEAHLLTTLLPSVEHLILIGDHLQLRPQIQNYELSRENHRGGEQYSLDMSLFERLVQPADGVGMKIPFNTLETQRRMHPSIARLVRDTLYPRLEDAPLVAEYPPVAGMRKRLFWLDHREFEAGSSSQDAMATSHWNEHEIQLTTALVSHLIQQGVYKNGEIAVLTPYLGQLHRLRRHLSQTFAIVVGERDQEGLANAGFEDAPVEPRVSPAKATLLKTLRVATIDNFQGEEAKVVVISLVRSNPENKCGFLRTSNRINVLLSRAQHGMYIIGNSATSRHVLMWAQVVDILKEDDNFGTSLALQCPRHPETAIHVKHADDFVRFSPEGGCDLRCAKRLSCGHKCVRKCHSDILHEAVCCQEPCPRPLKGCSHPCPKPCGNQCPTKCMVMVFQKDRILPCGHLLPNLPCWQAQDLSTVNCSAIVKKEGPRCGHQISVACHLDLTSPNYRCKTPCRTNLPCGHTCKRACWECNTSTDEETKIDHGPCKQKCGRNQSTCSHVCDMTCHGEVPCLPCQSPCNVQCGHSKCPKKCSEPCAPCAEPACLSLCPHSTCSMPCAAPCNHVPCSLRCQKVLSCGHMCPSVCGEACPPQEFCQVCADPDIKNTDVDFILGKTYHEIDLDETPCIFPQCGHFLTMESMDAQMSLGDHYALDFEGRPISIATSSQPFSMSDVKTCAVCRGSLRNISRYGRLVRRALLDESTKKLILYTNQEYIPIAKCLVEHLQRLHDLEDDDKALQQLFYYPNEIKLEGSRNHQVYQIYNLMKNLDRSRWHGMMDLRRRILKYTSAVNLEEQPFRRVWNFVENIRRRQGRLGSFELDNNVLQTKGYLQGTALLLRLDTALLADFISLYAQATSNSRQTQIFTNFEENRKECQVLVQNAKTSRRIPEQIEGYILMTQLYAMEMSTCSDPAQSAKFQESGKEAINAAADLCLEYPGQTSGLKAEVEETEKMLKGSSFYSTITNEERMAVVSAMALEFRGTGHWYYCENGHPFTIGECGGAVQLSRCPECNAPVGGSNHRTAEGVRPADDLEGGFNRMAI